MFLVWYVACRPSFLIPNFKKSPNVCQSLISNIHFSVFNFHTEIFRITNPGLIPIFLYFFVLLSFETLVFFLKTLSCGNSAITLGYYDSQYHHFVDISLLC